MFPTSHKDLDAGTAHDFWAQVRELMSNPETMRELLSVADQSEVTYLAVGLLAESVTEQHFTEGLYLALVDAVNEYLNTGRMAA